MTHISQFRQVVNTYIGVPKFVRQHRLWSGFFKHRLVAGATVVLGLVISFTLMKVTFSWWQNLSSGNIFNAGLQTPSLIKNLAMESLSVFYKGGYKYLILIIMEMLIFHMVLRTQEILTGVKEELSSGLFMKAQVRMIKVAIFVFIMEIVFKVVFEIMLSILDLDLLEGPLIFLLQCYFLGFAIVDNYFEIQGFRIRVSFKASRGIVGICVGVGIVLYVLLLVPLVGPIVGPMMAAVATTIVLNEREDNTTRGLNYAASDIQG